MASMQSKITRYLKTQKMMTLNKGNKAVSRNISQGDPDGEISRQGLQSKYYK